MLHLNSSLHHCSESEVGGHLKVAVEVGPLVAQPATHQVEAVLVLPAWLKIILAAFIMMGIHHRHNVHAWLLIILVIVTVMEKDVKATCPTHRMSIYHISYTIF